MGQEDPSPRVGSGTSVFLPKKIPWDRGAWWATDYEVAKLDNTEHPCKHAITINED